MANFELIGADAPLNPPDPQTFKPAAPPKWAGDNKSGPQPTKAANANDSGWLWWDHDDPGQNGHQGYSGTQGIPGDIGLNGGDTPIGVRFTISQSINGVFDILLHGGNGQPGGKGGPGGDGGEGQDGGDSDDEQPAGLGGQGGIGGMGGTGGAGGLGGNINAFYLTIGVDIATNQISVQYEQGMGGRGGDGGEPGNGGPGGFAGAGNGSQNVSGPQGLYGNQGLNGHDGYVDTLTVIA